MPNELLSKLADYVDRPTWDAYRLASRATAANAVVVAKSVVVRRRADLIPALTAYKPGGITKLTAAHCELGDAEAQHLAVNTSITSLNLWGNNTGDAGVGQLAGNTSITSLNLSHDEIGAAGAQALAATPRSPRSTCATTRSRMRAHITLGSSA